MVLDASSIQQGTLAAQGALQVLMSLHLTSSKYPEENCVFGGFCFDYIIVGAGTAGCVLASRLAEDDKSKVLLIEAGKDPQLVSDLPALLFYGKSSDDSWNYTIEDPGLSLESHKHTDDDTVLGRLLGGTSSKSYMLYSSGNKYDYNNWAKIVKDSTWEWKNVLPYLKKSQRLEDPDLVRTDSQFYGSDGNIGLTVLRDAGNIKSEPYYKAFKETGTDSVPSVNGNVTLGYTNSLYTISNGVRQNTALTYLKPEKPNLYIMKNTLVIKIVFDAYKNAVGVKVKIHNERYAFISAKKEVIASAGVVNSPKLLMLSGIGPKKQLCKLGIETISDHPVGEGLQDHLGVSIFYNMTKIKVPHRPFNSYKIPATTILGLVAINRSEGYPDYQSYSYVGYPLEFMRYCAFTYYYIDSICNSLFSTDVNTEMMFSVITKQKFKSRGRVVLKSHDYRVDPLIYTNYFTQEEDLEDFARIMQDYARVEDTDSFKKLGAKFLDPKLANCGEYNKHDLEYWKCYVQYMMTSHHHYSSTCAMGLVVDSRLRVYGVRRLRVVDASIMPNPTAAGTLGSTIAIGEKAADFIKEGRNKD